MAIIFPNESHLRAMAVKKGLGSENEDLTSLCEDPKGKKSSKLTAPVLNSLSCVIDGESFPVREEVLKDVNAQGKAAGFKSLEVIFAFFRSTNIKPDESRFL
jgi:hypothetical protein